MRPATALALVAAIVLVGVVLAFSVTDPEPPPPTPTSAMPVQLTPTQEPGAASPEATRRVLDELQDKEEDEFGKSEAARRRSYREQLLEQRPSASD